MKKIITILSTFIAIAILSQSTANAGINFNMPACGADLTITSMSITPATPSCRDTIKVNITVKNIGDANAIASITRILLDNVSVYNVATVALTPGQTAIFTNM